MPLPQPSLHDSPTAPTLTPPAPLPGLGSYYGSRAGKPGYARETSAGNWQVKVHDPTNRLATHDGWLLVGTGWATLPDACSATGLS